MDEYRTSINQSPSITHSVDSFFTRCQMQEESCEMLFAGFQLLLPLNLETNLALSGRQWHHANELYAIVAGIASKSARVQCCTFLLVPRFEAMFSLIHKYIYIYIYVYLYIYITICIP